MICNVHKSFSVVLAALTGLPWTIFRFTLLPRVLLCFDSRRTRFLSSVVNSETVRRIIVVTSVTACRIIVATSVTVCMMILVNRETVFFTTFTNSERDFMANLTNSQTTFRATMTNSQTLWGQLWPTGRQFLGQMCQVSNIPSVTSMIIISCHRNKDWLGLVSVKGTNP